MRLSFIRYFFSYLIHAKTRQRLLFIAIFGLALSSFALIVLQSTMGGLQSKLIARSKSVKGHGVIEFPLLSQERGDRVVADLTRAFSNLKKEEPSLRVIGELELELLIKYGSYYAPLIIHGIDPHRALPPFLEGLGFKEIILPHMLSTKINATGGDLIRLMSPAHLDEFMGDIPRMSSLYVDHLISTDVQDVDEFHAWANLLSIQSLLKKRVINRIRLFGEYDRSIVLKILKKHSLARAKIFSWEKKNETLVWALGLETTVMVFLFFAMSLLVSLSIISGLLIFFSKVKGDMASFWILGTSEREILKSSKLFLFFLSFSSVFSGLLLGLFFLFALDYFGPNIMPDVFVDRRIPIAISVRGLFISFFIPFGIGSFFAHFSLRTFQREIDYLSYIRSLGR